MPASCNASSAGALALRSRYGANKQALLADYAPQLQALYCRPEHVPRLFTGKAPTLYDIQNAYSSETAEAWLGMQLMNLNEFANVGNKLTEFQLDDLAKCIAATFGHLKTTELMFFFHLFKCGKFGRFYGSVDGLIIMGALQDFMKLRADELTKCEQAERDAARAAEDAERLAEAMSREEWDEVSWLYNLGYEPWRIAQEAKFAI